MSSFFLKRVGEELPLGVGEGLFLRKVMCLRQKKKGKI